MDSEISPRAIGGLMGNVMARGIGSSTGMGSGFIIVLVAALRFIDDGVTPAGRIQEPRNTAFQRSNGRSDRTTWAATENGDRSPLNSFSVVVAHSDGRDIHTEEHEQEYDNCGAGNLVKLRLRSC